MNTTPHTAKAKAKIAASKVGKPRSDDTRRRIAAGMLKYHERVRAAMLALEKR